MLSAAADINMPAVKTAEYKIPDIDRIALYAKQWLHMLDSPILTAALQKNCNMLFTQQKNLHMP